MSQIEITVEVVKKVAKLAALKISDDEVDLFRKQLNGIMKWIDQLQEVDTSSIIEGNEDETKLQMHKDEVKDGGYQELVLKNAPNSKYGYFVVNKVIE